MLSLISSGIECDDCKCILSGERVICLTCKDPVVSDSFDLCSGCRDLVTKRRAVTHTADHTLIKARKHIHKHVFVWLVFEAKLMSTRLKNTFAELQKKEGGYITEAHRASTGGPLRAIVWLLREASEGSVLGLHNLL